MLAELEAEQGGEAPADLAGGFGGRLAFGGGGDEEAQRAQRERERRIQRAEAAALNSDSDMGSDEVGGGWVLASSCSARGLGSRAWGLSMGGRGGWTWLVRGGCFTLHAGLASRNCGWAGLLHQQTAPCAVHGCFKERGPINSRWRSMTVGAACIFGDPPIADEAFQCFFLWQDEDAEAKAARLGRQLAGGANAPADAAAPGATPAAGRAPAAGAAATGGAAAGFRPAADATEGPISIELPGRRRRRAAGAAAGQQGAPAAAAGAGDEGEGALGLPAQHQRLLAGEGKSKGKAPPQQQPQQGAAPAALQVTIGPAGAAAPAAEGNASAAQQQQQPAFVAASKFGGARPGYVFKKGPKGVGYYLDAKERARAERQAAKQARQAAQRAEQAAEQQRQQQNGAGEADSEDEGNMRPVGKVGGSLVGRKGAPAHTVQKGYMLA